MIKRRFTGLFSVFTILVILLSACASDKDVLRYEADPKMKASIKVLYPGGEDWFMRAYGELFLTKYPNIEITVIDYPLKGVDEIVEQEKPDVLALRFPDYERFIQEDKLYDLNAMITNDSFDLEKMHPDIVDFLRQRGGGKLYGLPPTFLNKAIFYNKDLFDKYEIPYPEDRMTWDELIQLAQRFPAEEGVNGLYMQDLSFLVSEMALSRGVSRQNAAAKKVTMDTESFKDIFETAIDAYQSKAVVSPELGGADNDPFIMGTSAMTVNYFYYINNAIGWAQRDLGNKFQLNWELASGPGDDGDRATTSSLFFTNIFAVNAGAGPEQLQAAWELVKFVNGEEAAKLKSKTAGFDPPTRTEYMYNPEGKRMEAFYDQKPNLKDMSVDYSMLPEGYSGKLDAIINAEGKSVLARLKTLDEAIADIQERGQAEMDK
ncbi:ABC transporter substrate-binding protein [Fontibacillus sp. BL9]|uniref:ABC transporter substrate-binding protein n=1 Tax=Fontibacillus sp. BL9 TaxID=3389971 RepID=UPI00397920B4